MGGHPAGLFHGDRPVLKLMYAALIRGAGAASSSASSRSGSSKPPMQKRITRTSGRSWALEEGVLELGSKNFADHLDDADLDLAVANTAWGEYPDMNCFILYRIPGDLNEGAQGGNLFVIQGISTARIGEIVRRTTDISLPDIRAATPSSPAADSLDQ
jgi:hypothetical protein